MMGKCELGIRRISVVLVCISLMVGISIGLSGCEILGDSKENIPTFEIGDAENSEMRSELEKYAHDYFGDDVQNIHYYPMKYSRGISKVWIPGSGGTKMCPEDVTKTNEWVCAASLVFNLKQTNDVYTLQYKFYKLTKERFPDFLKPDSLPEEGNLFPTFYIYDGDYGFTIKNVKQWYQSIASTSGSSSIESFAKCYPISLKDLYSCKKGIVNDERYISASDAAIKKVNDYFASYIYEHVPDDNNELSKYKGNVISHSKLYIERDTGISVGDYTVLFGEKVGKVEIECSIWWDTAVLKFDQGELNVLKPNSMHCGKAWKMGVKLPD